MNKQIEPMTPGPFPLTLTEFDYGPNYPSQGTRYVIVTNQGNHWITTHDPHAAKLSLAAPDMLKALIRLVNADEGGEADPDFYTALDAATAAIAKAEGKDL